MSIKSKLNLFCGYFFRWIGFPVEPDLIKIGNPNKESPVFLTCNFNLTVKRVLKALKGLNCYLLIAPSNGINVWCGACGDDFNTYSVISIIKTSGINELVSHRTLILPQLSAPGIDPIEIKKKLGWKVKFGPVYAKDIPKFLHQGCEKTEQQRKVKFPISKRIEMANLYFFTITLIFSIIYWIIVLILPPPPDVVLFINLIIIIMIVIYASLIILPSIKTKTGKPKILIFEGILISLIIYFYGFVIPNLSYLFWSAIISIIAIIIILEDFNGLTPIYKSELGEKTWKKGEDKMKFLFSYFKLQPYGVIKLEKEKCIGCKYCIEVCPRNLYTFNELSKKVNLHHPENCINCNACVKRCLGNCLKISHE